MARDQITRSADTTRPGVNHPGARPDAPAIATARRAPTDVRPSHGLMSPPSGHYFHQLAGAED